MYSPSRFICPERAMVWDPHTCLMIIDLVPWMIRKLTVFCVFAKLGFYYVCVDFNPQHTGSLVSQASQHLPVPSMSSFSEDVASSPSGNQSSAIAKPEQSPRARRESLTRGAQRLGRSSSSSRSPPSSNVATMSGFYFHTNSEP